jgi:hypothetical protein
MYPITVQEIGEGIVKGRERLVTMNSGVYGWEEPDLHYAYRYDARGRMIPGNFVTTVASDRVRTRVTLANEESCALVRVPARLDAAAPVNLILRRYDERGVEMLINGRDSVTLTLGSGDFEVQADRRYNATVSSNQEVLTSTADADGVRFALTLDGPTSLTIAAE